MKNAARCLAFDLEGKIDVLHATHSGRAFSPHSHEEYAVGLIDAGVEQFEYRGATQRAVTGQVVLMTAGEVHTGEAADRRGFGFWMLYVPGSTKPLPRKRSTSFRCSLRAACSARSKLTRMRQQHGAESRYAPCRFGASGVCHGKAARKLETG